MESSDDIEKELKNVVAIGRETKKKIKDLFVRALTGNFRIFNETNLYEIIISSNFVKNTTIFY